MKPIAVFQHTEVGAPGSILSILESLGKRCQVIRIVDGEAVPENARDFSGLVFLGGYMSVHDTLPWIAPELALIREADRYDIPVAGHCLGSQLLALALGGRVYPNHRREIGWQHITVESVAESQEWWGQGVGASLLTFQWHGDTFEPPAGAVRIATSAHCVNQTVVIRGLHLGVQSHLEMTPGLVALSLQRNGAQLEREYLQGNPAVSSMEEAQHDVEQKTACMQATLTRLYSRWAKGLEP